MGNGNIENHILTVFEFTKAANRVKFRCLGCKELIRGKSILPNYIKGQIEFQSRLIPLIDLGQQFCDCPTPVNENNCVIVFEHGFDNRKFHTGFLVENFEKILEITLWDAENSKGSDSDQSLLVILDFIKGVDEYAEDILWKNHLIVSYLAPHYQEPMAIS